VVTKVKTRVVRKTLNPVFDETFTFYGIDANQLTGISLHFVVLSFDRFSRDDVIGEVVYQLEGMDVESGNKSAVCVCRQIEQRHVKVRPTLCCISGLLRRLGQQQWVSPGFGARTGTKLRENQTVNDGVAHSKI